jgi:hypothetical protein
VATRGTEILHLSQKDLNKLCKPNNLDQSLVRAILDRLEILSDDLRMTTGELAVLADPRVQRTDVAVESLLTVTSLYRI